MVGNVSLLVHLPISEQNQVALLKASIKFSELQWSVVRPANDISMKVAGEIKKCST